MSKNVTVNNNVSINPPIDQLFIRQQKLFTENNNPYCNQNTYCLFFERELMINYDDFLISIPVLLKGLVTLSF